MVGIPSFDAQISRISVPSIQNFQEGQNEQIYKAVAGIANSSAKVAEELYSNQQMHKAKVQGAEDFENAKKEGKEFKLNELPTPVTKAQAAYNESAINSFAAQYTVDTSFALTNIEDENRDNPFGFLDKAQAYINGASKDIPDYLKPQIVKPLEMNMRSIYSSLLKKKIESNRRTSQALTMINIDELVRDADNTEDPVVQDQKIGNIFTIVKNAAATGDISGEYAIKKIKEVRQGVASQRLTNQLLTNNNDPKTINTVIAMAMQGKTGIEAFDTLSPEERADSIKTALGHISYAKGYLGQVAEMAGKYAVNQAQLDMYNNLAPKTQITPDILKDLSWGNKTFYNIMSDAQNDTPAFENETFYSDVESGVKNGTIGEKQIIDAYEGGYISGKDAIVNLNVLFSPLSVNKKTEAYNTFKTNLDSELKDMFNGIGMKSKTNVKKKYIEENMDNFLSTGEKTPEEISAYSDVLHEKANKRFTSQTEYEPVYTPEWFKEKTGYSISAIENAVAEASVSGQIDMKKLRSILLDMTGNDQHQANSIYSMYLAVKNQ